MPRPNDDTRAKLKDKAPTRTTGPIIGEGGRLKIAKGLPLAGALMGELQAFQVRLTAKGRDTYAARSGGHDDLVLAVALAVWRCQSLSPLPARNQT